MTSAAAPCPACAGRALPARLAVPGRAPVVPWPAGRCPRLAAADARGLVLDVSDAAAGIPGIAGLSAVRVAVAVPAVPATAPGVAEPATAPLPVPARLAAALVPGIAARLPVAVPEVPFRVAGALTPAVPPARPPWAGWALAEVLAAAPVAGGRSPLLTKPATPWAASGPGYW